MHVRRRNRPVHRRCERATDPAPSRSEDRKPGKGKGAVTSIGVTGPRRKTKECIIERKKTCEFLPLRAKRKQDVFPSHINCA